MKKLVAGLVLTAIIGVSNAQAYPDYHTGYRHGKNDAYQNVATTLFAVGAIVIVGTMFYRLNEESHWGVNNKGLTYKF